MGSSDYPFGIIGCDVATELGVRCMKHGYDGELRRHDPLFRRAWAVRPGDHVLDVGCGGGQTTARPRAWRLRESAGFADVAFEDVREPVYYGADADAALEWVRGFASTKAMLAHLDQDHGPRRLRSVLAGRADSTGVWFGSRSWIVTARRR